jgi:hypothetical protein
VKSGTRGSFKPHKSEPALFLISGLASWPEIDQAAGLVVFFIA